MHRIKATDLAALRNIFAEREPELLSRLLDRLDPETRACFETAVPIDWVPAENICKLHVAAADILFPKEKAALTHLGEELATRSFSTVYKLLLALPSLSFVVRRTPILWSLYHGAGEATIEEQRATSMRLVVRGAPELPSPLADVISGHILALGKVTKTKNVRVRVESRNPEEWSWKISWEK